MEYSGLELEYESRFWWVPSLVMSRMIFDNIKRKEICIGESLKLVVYYILDYFGILFILDINSVPREFILWDQRLFEGLLCEKF